MSAVIGIDPGQSGGISMRNAFEQVSSLALAGRCRVYESSEDYSSCENPRVPVEQCGQMNADESRLFLYKAGNVRHHELQYFRNQLARQQRWLNVPSFCCCHESYVLGTALDTRLVFSRNMCGYAVVFCPCHEYGAIGQLLSPNLRSGGARHGYKHSAVPSALGDSGGQQAVSSLGALSNTDAGKHAVRLQSACQ